MSKRLTEQQVRRVVKYFSESRGQILGLTRAAAAERSLTVRERVDTKRMWPR